MADAQFDLTQDLPVGLDRLWAALGRPEYVEQKYRALGSEALRLLQFSADAEVIDVQLERQAPVARDELPLWARVLSGRRQALRHHTRWRRSGAHRVEVSIEVVPRGLPLVATGTGAVVERPRGQSHLALHVEVGSRTPALPARVAQLFAQQVQHALEADLAFTLDYFGTPGGGPG